MARLIDIRTAIGERLDHAPTQSDTWKARINADINAALEDLSLDAPFPLFERTVTLETAALWEPFDDTDTISDVSSDPWTIARDTVRTSVDADEQWETDGTWSGRTLAVQQSDETWRLHRIRRVYYHAASDTERITLYEPMDPSALYDAAAYRIFDPALWLPGDVSRVLSVKALDANGPIVVQPMPKGTYDRLLHPAVPDLALVGPPRGWYPFGRTSIPAPTEAPTLTQLGNGTWTGSIEPSGAFVYCYTRCWGYRPGISAFQPGAGVAAATRTPLWESAPSPVSASIDLTGGTTAVRVTLPDDAHVWGFRDGTSPRSANGGWFFRLYRKRTDTKAGGRFVEEQDDYVFLADVNSDDANHYYEDTGASIPDPSIRVPEHTDYFGIGLYPHADATYPLEVSYVEQPRRLSDDYDTVPLPRNCDEALVEYALARSYERAGDLGAAEIARNRARHRLDRISAQRGPTIPHSTVQYRRSARGRPMGDPRFDFVGWRTTRSSS